MEITTREEALSNKQKYYFTNKQCNRGHLSKRLTATRACWQCCLENGKKWRDTVEPEVRRVRSRQQYATAKERGKTYIINKQDRYASDDVVMFHRAKQRARLKNIPFTITLTDIVIPSFCPILGLELIRNKGGKQALPNSPSLDRINPNLGYVPGNVRVISFRANTIKNNATKDEIYKVWLSM